MHTIMTQPGHSAPGRCASFTGPARPGGCCARCGQPDYAHQADGQERQTRTRALDGDYGPEPYCTACGASVGIFLAHGGDWKHYRWDYAPGSKPEVYEAGHAPVIGWRRGSHPESAVAY